MKHNMTQGVVISGREKEILMSRLKEFENDFFRCESAIINYIENVCIGSGRLWFLVGSPVFWIGEVYAVSVFVKEPNDQGTPQQLGKWTETIIISCIITI
mmetsp:Transcript_15991/g.33260  ORF Transcript_15991/g.33260 Transcript_15991/m.33260 type:complete len:100 (-) Transcript_15991:3-302(-)